MRFDSKLNTLTTATDSKSYSHYDFGNVILEEGRMIASDGFCMYVANYTADKNFKFPIAPGETEKPVTSFPLAVPAKAINKAFKNAPKKAGVEAINNTVCIQADEKSIRLHTTDLESYDTVSVKNKPVEFPDCDATIKASKSENTVTFCLGRQNLEKLVKMVKSQNKDLHALIKFTLPVDKAGNFNNSPVIVEFNDITGYLMPTIE